MNHHTDNKKCSNLRTPNPPSTALSPRNKEFVLLNETYSSMNSDVSGSSVSSIESLLESRRENPEEILLALGFGGQSQEQFSPLTRIPYRFFKQQSNAKGVHVADVAQMRNQMFFQNYNAEEMIKSNRRFNTMTGNFGQSKTKENNQKTNRKTNNNNNSDNNDNANNNSNNNNSKVLLMDPKRFQFNLEGQNDVCSKKSQNDFLEENSNRFLKSTSSSVIEKGKDDDNNRKSPNQNETKMEFLYPNTFPYRKLSCPFVDLSHQQEINIFKKELINDKLNISSNECEDIWQQLLKMNNEYRKTNFDLISTLLDIDVNSLLMIRSFIETSLLISIQSLKISLDFYRYFMFIDSKKDQNEKPISSFIKIKNIQGHQGNEISTEFDGESLTFQKLYLDILEIETMLDDALFKLKNSSNWIVFISKYVQQLRTAINKIFKIRIGLQKLSSKYNEIFNK